MSSQHITGIKKTAKYEWWFATCSCGWRSLAYPEARKCVAERNAEMHAKTMAEAKA